MITADTMLLRIILKSIRQYSLIKWFLCLFTHDSTESVDRRHIERNIFSTTLCKQIYTHHSLYGYSKSWDYQHIAQPVITGSSVWGKRFFLSDYYYFLLIKNKSHPNNTQSASRWTLHFLPFFVYNARVNSIQELIIVVA